MQGADEAGQALMPLAFLLLLAAGLSQGGGAETFVATAAVLYVFARAFGWAWRVGVCPLLDRWGL